MSKKRSPEEQHPVFGIGFYRREQWPLLLETADDRKELEDTYDEWKFVGWGKRFTLPNIFNHRRVGLHMRHSAQPATGRSNTS